jgi:hypothetical protein
METSTWSFSRLENVSLTYATVEYVNASQARCQSCVCNLLRIVLFDLIKSQECIFARELVFQGVKENLILRSLRLAVLERLMDFLGAAFERTVTSLLYLGFLRIYTHTRCHHQVLLLLSNFGQ